MNRRCLLKRAAGAVVALPCSGAVSGQPAATRPGGPRRTKEQSGTDFRQQASPCSLRKVCRALARSRPHQVSVEGALGDQRIVWAFRSEPSVEAFMGHLAELTGSEVLTRRTRTVGKEFVLRALPETVRLEAGWRTEGLVRTLSELERAAQQWDAGDRDLSAFPAALRFYARNLHRFRSIRLQELRQEQIDDLLSGRLIQYAPGALPAARIDEMVAERFAGRHGGDEPPEVVQRAMERELEEARRHGLALQMDLHRKGARSHLMLWFGRPGRAGNVLCAFEDVTLGLPLTRTNPYHLLATRLRAPARDLPPVFARPLERDVHLPRNGRWESVLEVVASETGWELVSDAYLCRPASKLQSARARHQELAALHERQVRAGVGVDQASVERALAQAEVERPEGRVLAPRGIPLADALDRICREYAYLWWEKEGCLYFRTAAWVWDRDYEIPDTFLDSWRVAVGQGRAPGAPDIAALASLTPLHLNGLEALGGRVFASAAPDNREWQQFFKYFRSVTPREQGRILSDGLVVRASSLVPDGGGDDGSDRRADAADAAWVRLRVTAEPDRSVTPPVTSVRLELTRVLGGQQRQSRVSVSIPHLSGQ